MTDKDKMTDREINFLDELAELTKKYNIKICGCGCCGSPYLEDLTNEIWQMGEKLTYNEEKQKYEIDNWLRQERKGS